MPGPATSRPALHRLRIGQVSSILLWLPLLLLMMTVLLLLLQLATAMM